MAISTHTIADIGHPTGSNNDPGCPRTATMYVPDPAVHPEPWHCIVATESAFFQNTGNGPITPLTDFANAGFLGLFVHVRLIVDTLAGQTTDGKYPQQTDDMKVAMRYMRTNPGGFGYTVTGKVASIGGSAGAYIALWMALDGTAALDKADAAICLSPVTDMSNRDTVSGLFKGVCQQYGRTTAADTPSELATLLSESPIALTLATANPILHFNGDNEQMPLTEFSRMVTAMATAGAAGYTPVLNTGNPLGRLHSWAYWTTGTHGGLPFTGVSDTAIAWLTSVFAGHGTPSGLTTESDGVSGQYQKYFG